MNSHAPHFTSPPGKKDLKMKIPACVLSKNNQGEAEDRDQPEDPSVHTELMSTQIPAYEFIVALFIIAKNQWQPRYPQIGEWLNQ